MTTLTLDSLADSRRYSARRVRASRSLDRRPIRIDEPPAGIRLDYRVARRYPVVLSGLALIIIALHVWALAGFIQARHAEIRQPEKTVPVEIQLVRPPPPPVPEVVPPKPPPPIAQRTPPRPAPRPQPVKPAPVPAQAPTLAAPAENTVSVAEAPTPPVAEPAPAVAQAVPAPPAPAAPEPVTEPRGSAGYLNNPAPDYPELAQERGWQGRVHLKVYVQASGKPSSVAVAQSSGKKVLDDAAIKAVAKWTFMPAKRGSTPIDGWVQVPIDFKL